MGGTLLLLLMHLIFPAGAIEVPMFISRPSPRPSSAQKSPKDFGTTGAAPSEDPSFILGGKAGVVAFTPPPGFMDNSLVPDFANTTETNVTVLRGRTAHLHCHVLNLGTKSVSWVRHEDIHVLTVGRITFTNDDRFEAHNTPGSGVWSLLIKYPQPRDAGKYECQISTRPPKARVIALTVVEPQAEILRAPELFVDRGSTLNLTCIIPDSPEPPEYVFWYHREKMVTYDGARSDVHVRTDKGDVTTSTLVIKNVDDKDSGLYTCAPTGMKEASTTVTVLNGELPQAMQTGSTCRAYVGWHVLLVASVLYHMAWWTWHSCMAR
ncbi:hemicentin-2-like [Oratosquilla oratoria]|uniref:hemicentin-2-like n=1 Tax=Oratosquilla oratoria TaxID=337810 RepID=UPI003F77365A